MNNIKFGLKLWSKNYKSASDLDEAKELIKKGIFNYVELLVVPESDVAPFRETKIPYIIHITHDNFGVNISDKEKEVFNLEAINNCIRWADVLDAEYLILHPGFGLIDNALDFLKKIDNRRILIENVPRVDSFTGKANMVGFCPKEIERLMGNKFGFCLDFGHAAQAAINLKKDYKDYIEEFLKLNPKVCHICDGSLKDEIDVHLNIGKGDYDFKFLMNCVKKSGAKYLTLETPRVNLRSLREDLENIKRLKSIRFFNQGL